MNRLVISKSIIQREYKSPDENFNRTDKAYATTIRGDLMSARTICDGDQGILEYLITTNLKYVLPIAKQYQNQGLALDDLINAGNIGLIIAAKRYDETMGFRFISYAFWWIRQSVIAAVAGHIGVARIPFQKLPLFGKLYKTFSNLQKAHSRKPSAGELADVLEIPVKDVLDLLSKPGMNSSLDEPFARDRELTLIDVLHNMESDNDDRVMFDSISEEVGYYLQMLNKRDRDLLIMYFGLSSSPQLTLDEIGKRLNITKEHAGRLKDKALNQLRNYSNLSL